MQCECTQSAANPSKKHQRSRDRKQIATLLKLLQEDLPDGIRYIGRPQHLSYDFVCHLVSSSKHNTFAGCDTVQNEIAVSKREPLGQSEVRVGLFAIEINKISLKKFSLVRKFVPKREYSLFKNRMSSRISRDRQKSYVMALLRENRRLRKANVRLQGMLNERNSSGTKDTTMIETKA